MAAPFIKGVGQVRARTLTLEKNLVIPIYPFGFEYARETGKVEAKGQVGGTLTTLASAPGEVTDTLTISTQYLDWTTKGFFLNELEVLETAPLIPLLKTGAVPVTGPYTYGDTAITATTVPSVYVSVNDPIGGIQTREMVTTAPNAGQVQVVAGTLTFHESDAAKTFNYQVPVSHQDTRSYGGANQGTYGTFELWGRTEPDGDLIWFPSVDFTGTPTIGASGTEAATLEITLTPNVPLNLGFTKPFKIYRNPVIATPSPSPSPTPTP